MSPFAAWLCSSMAIARAECFCIICVRMMWMGVLALWRLKDADDEELRSENEPKKTARLETELKSLKEKLAELESERKEDSTKLARQEKELEKEKTTLKKDRDCAMASLEVEMNARKQSVDKLNAELNSLKENLTKSESKRQAAERKIAAPHSSGVRSNGPSTPTPTSQQSGNSGVIEKRVVCVGDCNVGKSSLLLTYTRNSISDTYVSRVFYYSASLQVVDGKTVKLQLWNTTGNEDSKRLRSLRYPETDADLQIGLGADLEVYTQIWFPKHF
ncbi:hypothetical protein BLNAU_19135 [Blattamonas nauphoetae]|uniref:Uncharacterized protein n=1 Tax=Blattamonas nauphoetae TaxID=2049346 RepID=A0ABQ9X2C7_9EUKA|nr:hypothetical protein BLNAU_19135 [Blattamonas nauphoetae]